MTIGGASHRALVRILMHARSTEAHAYVRANYTRDTGSLAEERAASAIVSSSNSSRGTSAEATERRRAGSVTGTGQIGKRVEGHERLRTRSATA
jgi:hypothetical protein